MANAVVKLYYQFEGEKEQSIVLDCVNDISVTTSSTVTTHPIVNGDTIADHMFREPVSLSFGGTFSLNGSGLPSVSGGGSKLGNLEALFEKIQSEGAFCRIVKTSTTSSNSVIFQERSSMVLTSISWTEHINSVDYRFSFAEAMTAEFESETATVDTSDENNPSTGTLAYTSFTESLFDASVVEPILASLFYKNGLLSEDFYSYLIEQKNYKDTIGSQSITSLVESVLSGAIVGTITGSVPGLLVGASVAFYAFTAASINEILKNMVDDAQYAVDVFKTYQTESENQNEIERWDDLAESLKTELKQLDSYVRCFTISENIEQTCYLTADDKTFRISFFKLNVDGAWSASVDHISGIDEEGQEVIGGLFGGSKYNITESSIITFEQCAYTKPIWLGKSTRLYFVRYNRNADNDLTDIMVVVTSIDPKNLSQAVTDIIYNSMLR